MKTRSKPFIGFFAGIACLLLGYLLSWMGTLLSFADFLKTTGIIVALISGFILYIRWRRKRLWWIHRQLRTAFVRATLIPLLLGTFLTLTLIYLLSWFQAIQLTRIMVETLINQVELKGIPCRVTDRQWSCGTCLSLPEPVSNNPRGRFALSARGLPEAWKTCSAFSDVHDHDLVLFVPDRGQEAYRVGIITRTDFSRLSQRLRIPVNQLSIFYPDEFERSPDTYRRTVIFTHLVTNEKSYNFVVPYPLTLPSRTSQGFGAEAMSTRSALLFEIDILHFFKNLIADPHVTGRITLGISIVFVLFAGMTAIVGALIIFQGFYSARQIGRTINAIETAMNRIASGDIPLKVPVKRTDQLGHLARQIEQTSISLHELINEKIEHERLSREIEIARTVQQRLFPETVPSWPGLDIAVQLIPALKLSGDYYDFFDRDSIHSIVVADVVGKGLPASLLMANVHAILHFAHFYLKSPHDVIRLFETINDHLLIHTEPHQFVSMVYTAFQLNPHRFVFASAGHPPALLFQPGSPGQLLHSTGPILGVLPDAKWTFKERDFPPGSCLVLCSDGILETRNPRGEEFGIERLKTLLDQVTPSSSSAQDIVNAINLRLHEWSESDEFRDDILVLVVTHRADRIET